TTQSKRRTEIVSRKNLAEMIRNRAQWRRPAQPCAQFSNATHRRGGSGEVFGRTDSFTLPPRGLGAILLWNTRLPQPPLRLPVQSSLFWRGNSGHLSSATRNTFFAPLVGRTILFPRCFIRNCRQSTFV